MFAIFIVPVDIYLKMIDDNKDIKVVNITITATLC